MKIILVKYGGSAITNKSTFETANHDIISNNAKDIRSCIRYNDLNGSKSDRNFVILIHGAGSFGHFQASIYGLSNGGHSSDCSLKHEIPITPCGINEADSVDVTNTELNMPCWHRGLILTRQSVLKLHKHVVDTHISEGIPAVAVSLFPLVKLK